mmetsp:Transcript_49891/g.138593  ORF Transcript_49891/g.138593 Transcript_49891/m.138593 type:complete len:847 (-) Transcript_49891:236-2776(-)
MALLAAVLAGLTLPQQAVAAKFDCKDTKDSANLGLNVLIGKSVNEDWCERLPETNQIDNLMDACEGFCGPANIPLLIGVPSWGFSLEEIDRVCLAQDGAANTVMSYEPDLMKDCVEWQGALTLIQQRLADMVAAVDDMNYAQLQFRVGVAKNVEKFVEVLNSEATRNLMMEANVDKTLPEYTKLLRDNLDDLLKDGQLQRNLLEVVNHLKGAATNLKTSLETNLPQLRQFIQNCGRTLTAVGAAKEYLLDVCNQRTSNCIESSSAKHIGCCCGAVPLAGSFGLNGESMLEDSVADTTPVDVCKEAAQLMEESLKKREAELRSTSLGSELLDQFKTSLERTYPDYFSRCDSNRRLRQASVRAAGRALPQTAEEEGLAARRLVDKLTGCDPKQTETGSARKGTALKAAFWAETESAYCDRLTPPAGKDVMDVAGLAEVCQSFCGAKSVPLVIGGTSFGFNQTSMDSVCLGGDLVQPDMAVLQKCQEQSTSFQKVQRKTAAVVSALSKLAVEKIHFEASIRKMVLDLKRAIADNAVAVIEDAAVGNKIDALQELLRDATLSVQAGGTARQQLDDAIATVEKAAKDLDAELSVTVDALESFVTDCNQLFTGVGSSNEYLLDLCSVTSTQCMDSASGRHAGCCCGYVPMLDLGKDSVPVDTIPGLSASMLEDNTGKARVASSWRRLGEVADQTYQICAESWNEAQPYVNAVTKKIRDLGYGELVDDVQAQLNIKYPESSCEPASPGQGNGAGTGDSGSEQVCEKDTGGRCRVFDCRSSRGPTDCESGKCLCKPGFCLDGNVCKESEAAADNLGVDGTGNRTAATAAPRRAGSALVVGLAGAAAAACIARPM